MYLLANCYLLIFTNKYDFFAILELSILCFLWLIDFGLIDKSFHLFIDSIILSVLNFSFLFCFTIPLKHGTDSWHNSFELWNLWWVMPTFSHFLNQEWRVLIMFPFGLLQQLKNFFFFEKTLFGFFLKFLSLFVEILDLYFIFYVHILFVLLFLL